MEGAWQDTLWREDKTGSPFKHVIWGQDSLCCGQQCEQQLVRARVVLERLLQDGDLFLCNSCFRNPPAPDTPACGNKIPSQMF